MKILKLPAMLIGAITMLFATNSCNKENDNDGIECCTSTVTEGGESYTAKSCEDGITTFTTTYANGEKYVETSDWHDNYDSWEELKQTFLDYGLPCD